MNCLSDIGHLDRVKVELNGKRFLNHLLEQPSEKITWPSEFSSGHDIVNLYKWTIEKVNYPRLCKMIGNVCRVSPVNKPDRNEKTETYLDALHTFLIPT